ncbi:acyl carrier protein [Streptomyces sp. NPDC050095]|uniref:acyl carrier protein n=1 Tax=unclassified Streptomyces TaxID=2593676 RepID=UPI00343B3CB3
MSKAKKPGATLSHTEALALVKEAIEEIVPDADFAGVGLDDRYRDALEIDSLDFLGIVELLAERAGVAIDEDDYADLTTLNGAAGLLAKRTGG